MRGEPAAVRQASPRRRRTGICFETGRFRIAGSAWYRYTEQHAEETMQPIAGRRPRFPIPAGSDARAQSRRWYVLGVLVVALLVIVLDNTVLNIALKTIADPRAGLGASQSQLEWAINSYTLMFAGLLFTFGVIGDRVGRKRMLIIGLVLFGLASLLSAYSHSPGQLIIARAAMGFGGAAVMPQTLSIISNVFDPKERAKAIGIWAAAVGAGIAIGPVLGGLLLDSFWWGSVFLINVPIVAAGVIAILFIVPESRNPDPGKIDLLGVVLSIAGLVLVVYGIIQGGQTGSWLRPDVLGPIAAGLAVLVLFGWHESRISHPSLDIRLFRDPRLSASVGAIALVFFALAGVIFFMSFYMQNVRGYSPLHAGLLTLPLAAGQMLFSPRSAALVKRAGAKAVCTGGLLMVAAALAGYHFFVGVATPIWVLGVIFFIQGAGMANVMPPATEAVMSVLPRERAGAGSALNNIARQVSVALGVAVLGSVLAQFYRTQLSPHLAALPASARGTASASIAGAQAVAHQLGPAGRGLVTSANAAFVHAMHITSLISAVIALLGALVVFVWMPGRRGVAARPERAAEPAGEAGEKEAVAEPVAL
jgi:EmrB/QacA subfamily drug resistance transporter